MLSHHHLIRPLALAVSATLAIGSLGLAGASSATAAQLTTPAPVQQRSSSTVTAVPLPTAQIDSGVVWTTHIVGDTVFAGGKFTAARPAGAEPGVNTVSRTNLLSFSLTTGVLTSFAPTFNGPVRSLASSPDGKTLYVGGTFTLVNGVTRYNFAAFDIATGALSTSFKPAIGGSFVNAIVATSSTVYVGGLIGAATGNTRKTLAAISVSTGKALAWAPTTDLQVDAMVLAPSGSKLIVGGRFSTVNGVTQRGLAALDLSDGSILPWTAPSVVINGWGTGDNAGKAGIYSLSADATSVYGTGWVYASAEIGNLEGSFKADGDTGDIQWLEDCHGDTYSSYSDGSNVYVTGHPHDCESVGGYPQAYPAPGNLRHALAFTASTEGTLSRSPNVSSIYKDWSGQPAPAVINWYPDWTTGTATGQGQAGWTSTGSGDYLVIGGEFPYVNGKRQQGLVRFARSNVAGTTTEGPRLSGTRWVPTARSDISGQVRITVPANWDRDDLGLTYQIKRSGTAQAVFTKTMDSTFWNLPSFSFVDTGLTPGNTYTYQVTATDSNGNVATSQAVSVVVSDADPGTYRTAVLTDGPSLYWKLGGSDGTTDLIGTNNAVAGSAVTDSATGALSGDSGKGYAVDGTDNGQLAASATVTNPTTFSVETWFQSSSTSGGKIFGFGSSASGLSSSYDRQAYLRNDGRVTYGVWTGQTNTLTSSKAYNDGKWHHVVATLGSAGMGLYVDGELVGSNTVNSAQSFTGYWRLGGDNLNGWPNQPSSFNLTGSLDEFAVYSSVLSAEQVRTHYLAGIGATPPTATFTAAVTDFSVAFSSAGSSSSDGSALTYSWDFGDGTTSTEANPTHVYGQAGDYSVALTVTDTLGLQTTYTNSVTVVGPHLAPTADFSSSAAGLTVTVDASASTASGGDSLTYSWNWGDGTSDGTGRTAQHSYAQAGDYQVTLTVTDDHGLTATKVSSVTATHAAPAAAFSASGSGLTVSVDGSASTAADGDGLTYSWNWGDSSSDGSGKTAKHSYAAAGSYSVTLTVSDDHGLSATSTKSVTVTHADPQAALSLTADGLKVSADGTGSQASDGASLTYSWDWGDSSSAGSGSTSTHTYSASGEYTVTLKVTDSLGSSATSTSSVKVVDPSDLTKVLAKFSTSTTSGWGSADVGGAWSTSPSSGFSVSDGMGRISLAAGQTKRASLSSANVSVTDVDASAVLAIDKLPAAGNVHVNYDLRYTDAGAYRLKVRISNAGAVNLVLARLVGTTETTLVTKTLSGVTYTAGSKLVVAGQLVSSGGSTTIKGKVWQQSDSEPSAWTATVTDSQAVLQGSGSVSIQAYVPSAVTNSPIVVSVDDLTVDSRG